MKRALTIAIITIAGVIFAGESVVILPFSVVNANPQWEDSLRAAFSKQLQNYGYEIFEADSFCYEIPCAGEIARQLHTSLALFGTVAGFGDQVVITSYLVRSDDEIEGKSRVSVKDLTELSSAVESVIKDFFPEKFSLPDSANVPGDSARVSPE